jgi:hypothetical protein
LDAGLFYQGIKPAVNVGLSVSRVGSTAQIKAMKSLAGTLKLELAQYREVADFVKFGSELDEATTTLINKGVRLTEVLKQDKYCPNHVLYQVFVIGLGVFDYYESLNMTDVIPVQNAYLRVFNDMTILKPFHFFLSVTNFDVKLFLKLINLTLLGSSFTLMMLLQMIIEIIKVYIFKYKTKFKSGIEDKIRVKFFFCHKLVKLLKNKKKFKNFIMSIYSQFIFYENYKKQEHVYITMYKSINENFNKILSKIIQENDKVVQIIIILMSYTTFRKRQKKKKLDIYDFLTLIRLNSNFSHFRSFYDLI